MKRKISILIILVLALAMVMSACNGNVETTKEPNIESTPAPTEATSKTDDRVEMTATIAGLKGPTSMGMVKVFSEVSELSEFVKLDYDIVSAPDVITAGLLSGEFTMAAVPTNLASVLYNKTEGNIRMLAVNTLGVIHIVADKSEEIDSLDDLRGKTLVTSGKGTVPEYVLNYLLEANGIDPEKDLTIEYRAEHSEVATLATTGEAKITLLPQPFVTIVTGKNQETELAVDLTEEWNKVAPEGSELAMGCLITTAEFADTYPQEVETLLAAYKESIEWVNEKPEEAAELIVEYEILPAAAIAIRAIPNCNIKYIYSQDSKDVLNSFYEILMGFQPKAIGGAVPGDDFYFKP